MKRIITVHNFNNLHKEKIAVLNTVFNLAVETPLNFKPSPFVYKKLVYQYGFLYYKEFTEEWYPEYENTPPTVLDVYKSLKNVELVILVLEYDNNAKSFMPTFHKALPVDVFKRIRTKSAKLDVDFNFTAFEPLSEFSDFVENKLLPIGSNPFKDRNAKCECGSGKKYKKCCLNNIL